MVRFLHTADWQLGKTFGALPDDLAAQVRAERQTVISRIAEAAKSNACAHVIVAGDVWDSTIPNTATIKQPLQSMSEHPEITWWLMPGNHDLDNVDGLWNRVEAAAPPNVRSLRKAQPVEMEAGVFLLPAPWARLDPGQDLSAWMDHADTPKGAIRIGVAHGSVRTFGAKDQGREDGDSEAIIAPDRAAKARLDYLALGDWHGRVAINSRTHYSGTPEPDRHKNNLRGLVLLVEIDGAGAEPRVTDIPTARYDWPVVEVTLGLDQIEVAIETIETALAEGHPLRDTIADVRLSGATTLAEWSIFQAAIEALRDECAALSVKGEERLKWVVKAEDLDGLDAQGSVRAAAESLTRRRDDPTLSQDDRDLAGHALRLLFGLAATVVDESVL